MMEKISKIQKIIDVIKNAKDFMVENNNSDMYLSQRDADEVEVGECEFKVIFSLLMLKRFSEIEAPSPDLTRIAHPANILFPKIKSNRTFSDELIEQECGIRALESINYAFEVFKKENKRDPSQKEYIKIIHNTLSEDDISELENATYMDEEGEEYALESIIGIASAESDMYTNDNLGYGFLDKEYREANSLPLVAWDFYTEDSIDKSHKEYSILKKFIDSHELSYAAPDHSHILYNCDGYHSITLEDFRNAIHTYWQNITQEKIFDWDSFFVKDDEGFFPEPEFSIEPTILEKAVSKFFELCASSLKPRVSFRPDHYGGEDYFWNRPFKRGWVIIGDYPLLELMGMFSSLDLSLENLSPSQFDDIILFLIHDYFETPDIASSANNKKFAEQMVKLLAPKLHESIYDPACGSGTNVAEVIKFCSEQEYFKSTDALIDLRADCQNYELKNYTRLRTSLLSGNCAVSFSNESGSRKKSDPEIKPALIISNPFIQDNIEWSWIKESDQEEGSPRSIDLLTQLLTRSLQTLDKKGRMAIVLPEYYLKKGEQRAEAQFKLLLEEDSLVAVVGVDNNKCILLVNKEKPKEKNQKVFFSESLTQKVITNIYNDFFSGTDEAFVSIDEIERNGFDLVPSTYTPKTGLEEPTDRWNILLDQKKGARLGKLCNITQGTNSLDRMVFIQRYGLPTDVLDWNDEALVLESENTEELIRVLNRSFKDFPITLGLPEEGIFNIADLNPKQEKIVRSVCSRLAELGKDWSEKFHNIKYENPFDNLANAVRGFGKVKIWADPLPASNINQNRFTLPLIEAKNLADETTGPQLKITSVKSYYNIRNADEIIRGRSSVLVTFNQNHNLRPTLLPRWSYNRIEIISDLESGTEIPIDHLICEEDKISDSDLAKIILIDDDSAFHGHMKRFAIEAKVSIQYVANVEDAIVILRNSPDIDGIILDHIGIQQRGDRPSHSFLLQFLKTLSETNYILPKVILSGSSENLKYLESHDILFFKKGGQEKDCIDYLKSIKLNKLKKSYITPLPNSLLPKVKVKRVTNHNSIRFQVLEGHQIVRDYKNFKELGEPGNWDSVPAMLDIPEVLISSDMASITPNSPDILDPEYLSYVLDTSLVKNQYEKLITLRNQKAHGTLPPGHAFKFASWIDALASIVIPIPSLTEQNIIYEEHKKTSLALKNSNRALRKKDREIFEKRKTELSDKAIKMNDSIAQLIHSLSPRLSGINSVIRSLLRRGEEDKLGFNKKDLIESDIEEMGTESIQEALESLLKDQQVCMELMTKWSELSQRAINREDFESIEMASFFYDIKNEFRRSAFKIKTFIPEGTIAEIDRKIFKEVITNIIRNASIHAFKKPQKKDQINFSIEIQGTNIIIDYWNNGTKFPKEITKSEFLSIGDPNMAVGGGGHGGSLINYFCENHRGEFNIIRNDYPIHFRFSFPVSQKFQSDVLALSGTETNLLEVLSVSAAETNHLIEECKIHSCPESYTYTKTKYITFRLPPNGEMKEVYKIKKFITLQSKEIETATHHSIESHWSPSLDFLKEIYGLSDSELDRLITYIKKNPFKRNKRFYFLSRHQVLLSPFFPSEYKTDPEYYSFDQLLGNDKNDPKSEE
jgi:hypothetical protein